MKSSALVRKTPLRSTSPRLRARIREFQRWAANVKARDGSCVACRDTTWHDTSLEAHHVYPKGKYPELRTVMENGLTLCRLCHKDWHSHSRGWTIWWKATYPDRARLMEELIKRPLPVSEPTKTSSAPAAPPAATGRSPRKAAGR